jgi:MSHA biogenesis protein MshJ
VEAWLAGTFARIDALTLRERAIGFTIALAFMVYLWHAVLYAPLDARRSRLAGEVAALRGDLEKLHGQTDALARLRMQDPDAAPRARLVALRDEAVRMREALVSVVDHLVPPEEMASVLEAVLTRETGLRMVSLESLGSELLASTAKPGPEPSATKTGARAGGNRARAAGRGRVETLLERPISVFRHGLRIRFQGDYLQTLSYLQALEALSWRFVWDSVSLSVTEHPESEVTITVYSMSLGEPWMGV